MKSVRNGDEGLCRKLQRLTSNKGKFSKLRNEIPVERKRRNKQFTDESYLLQVNWYYSIAGNKTKQKVKNISFLWVSWQTLASLNVIQRSIIKTVVLPFPFLAYSNCSETLCCAVNHATYTVDCLYPPLQKRKRWNKAQLLALILLKVENRRTNWMRFVSTAVLNANLNPKKHFGTSL